MSKQNGVSSARDWRALVEQGVDVTLPNGLAVRLKSVSVGYLLRTGKMPDGLTQVAMGVVIDPKDLASDEKKQEVADMLKLLDEYHRVICTEAFVNPRIVEVPTKEDEIAYEWLSEQDKQFVEGILNQPVIAWSRFCQEYHAGLEPVRKNEGNGDRSE